MQLFCLFLFREIEKKKNNVKNTQKMILKNG